MKKHIGSFLLMLILLITMAGCGSMEKEMTEGEKDKEDKIQTVSYTHLSENTVESGARTSSV